MVRYYAESESFVQGYNVKAYTEIEMEVTPEVCNYVHKGGLTSSGIFNNDATAKLYYYDNGSWHHYGTDTTSTYTGGTTQLIEKEDYWGRTDEDRYVGLACDVDFMGSTGSAQAWMTIPHRAYPPTNLHTSKYDHLIVIGWDNPSVSRDSLTIEVQIDGGAWAKLVEITSSTAFTYDYRQVSIDHAYRFRAYTTYGGTNSEYSNETNTVYYKPAAPKDAWFSYNDGICYMHLDNPSNVATKIAYRISDTGEAPWSSTVTVDYQTSAIPIGDSDLSGKYVSVKNICDSVAPALESEWFYSKQIVIGTPPAQPTWLSPTSNVVNIADGIIHWEWSYYNEDGSNQTQYTIKWKKNNVSQTDITVLSANHYHDMDISTFSTGDVISATVEVKGAGIVWSFASRTNQVTLRTAPTLSNINPHDDVDAVPITVECTYTDSGNFTCQYASFNLLKDGRSVLSKQMSVVSTDTGIKLSAQITESDLTLANSKEYTVIITARSSSGLQTTADTSFTTKFILPKAGDLQITNDPSTGYASLLATFDNHATDVEYSGATNAQFDTTEGYVRNLTVDGKSEKWNQHVYNGNFASTSNWTTFQSAVSFSVSGNVAKLTIIDNTRSDRPNLLNPTEDVPIGHKVYTFMECRITTQATHANCTFALLYGHYQGRTVIPNGTWQKYEELLTADNSAYNRRTVYLSDIVSTFTNGDTIEYRNVIGIDLTAIFGSGNEPATVDAFKATDVYKAKLAAGELYDYDAGSLVSIEGAGVVGRNLLEGCGAEATGSYPYGHNYKTNPLYLPYVIPAGTQLTFSFEVLNEVNAQCGIIPLFTDGTSSGSKYTPTGWTTGRKSSTFSWDKDVKAVGFYTSDSTTRVKEYQLEVGSTAHAYEPYSLATIPAPLRSAGSVHDTLMADADSWTVGRKVGVVDLGSLTWNYNSEASHQRLYAVVSGIKETTSYDVVMNIITPAFTTTNFSAVYNHTTDKSIAVRGNGVQVYDSSYTDKDTFKTAMSGVYLFYELATPTQDAETSMSTLTIGSAFTVTTDLDSTFEMVGWDGSADAVSISVARVNADGSITPLLEDGQAGAGIVDKYAPLNVAYEYAVSTKGNNNSINTVYVTNVFKTPNFFFYFDDYIASALWVPTERISPTRPHRDELYFSGRTLPMSIDDEAEAESRALSFKLRTQEEANLFHKLKYHSGSSIYKSSRGAVMHVNATVELEPDFHDYSYYGALIINMKQVSGIKL